MNTESKTSKEKCHRLIQWHGKVEKIIVDQHVYAWSGKIPCTGVKKCIYCGEIYKEEDNER